MMKTDITNTVGVELRRDVERRGARLYRLEAGTLMVRHPTTLDTKFGVDEQDMLAALTGSAPPKPWFKRRRGPS